MKKCDIFLILIFAHNIHHGFVGIMVVTYWITE